MLFETSPIEDEDSKKKRPSKRRKEPPRQRTEPVDYSDGYVPGYIASLDVPCERCGSTVTDLAEIGKGEWTVVCGWGCGRQWVIAPIPDVLDSRTTNKEFVLRDGEFKGKTFDEVWDSGNGHYIRGLVSSGHKRQSAKEAAKWLAKKGH